MNSHWKSIGARLRPARWTPTAWAAGAMVALCLAGTAIVGYELYSITGQEISYNAR